LKGLLKWVCLFWALQAGLVFAAQPVVFVLAASSKVVVTNTKGQDYSALPTQRLYRGHVITIPKGERFSAVVLHTGNRRVFNGPARLEVISDTIRLLKGPAAKVTAISDDNLDLIEQWMAVYRRQVRLVSTEPHPLEEEEVKLEAIQPVEDSLLLTRSPEFRFRGRLPREANLMLFDARGKRFWVEPLETLQLTLPPAAKFEWGRAFTWEVRKLTGGRVHSGSFQIASEETARALLEAKVPDTPDSLPESRLFYGMRLQLAKAYLEADEVWSSLGISMSRNGQPTQVRE
jgi:hypothetical protein